MPTARRKAEHKLDVRYALVRVAAAMKGRGGLEAGYEVMMMAVDEVDCMRAELALLRATLGRKKPAKIRIVGAP